MFDSAVATWPNRAILLLSRMKSTVLFVLFFSSVDVRQNNICKEFADYKFIESSPNCWYDPDMQARTDEIVIRYGYPIETYETVTEDSFILTVFRIPLRNVKPKGIVYLQHPALASSSVWLTAGNNSFPFLLSNAGYDVWMGNFRGTSYSEKHKFLSKSRNPQQYWNYSFHEFGIYDLTAQLNLVRKETAYQKKLIYIGHSVGTTSALIYSSLKPTEAEQNVAIFILWSPIAYMGHCRTPGIYLAPYTNYLMDFIKTVSLPNGITFDGIYHRTIEGVCLSSPSRVEECSRLLDVFVGPSYDQGNPTGVPALLYQSIEGFSMKALAHFGQMIISKGRFQWYDYGDNLNRVYYNSRYPPAYPVKKIKVPVRVVYGQNDYCAPEEDAYILYNNLHDDVKMGIKKVDYFNHFDFHYGKQVKEKVHLPTINFLDDYIRD